MSTAAPGVALAPRIQLDGRDLPASLAGTLVGLRVVHALRTTAWARLELVVDDGAKVFTPAQGVRGVQVGQPLTIAGRADDRPSVTTIFTGTVTRVEAVRGPRGGTRLVVTAQDGTAVLATESARTFVDQSYASMITTIAQAASLQTRLDGLPADPAPYTLQAGSALRFIDDIAQRTGVDWTLITTTLHTWTAGAPRPGAGRTTLRAEELLSAEVSQQSGGPTQAVVSAWDAEADAVVTGTRSRPGTKGVEVAERVVLDSTSSPLTSAEAERIAAARLSASGPVAARAHVGRLVPVEPGATLDVTDTWWPPDAEYVRETIVTWDRTGFTTEILTGSRTTPTLAALAGGSGQDRGAAAFTHDGVVVGVVTQLGSRSDKESRGRVKVSFPFLGSTVTSDWARVSSPGGGKDRGLLVMPEIDDEVLVAFEGSDVRRPVVVAGLFSTSRTAPGTDPVADGRIGRRALTSRSGHVVELADADDVAGQHVLLALAGGERRLRLGGDAVELAVPSGTPVTISSGSTRIRLTDDGAVTVEGTAVTITATRSLALEGPSVSVKASGSLTLEGADVTVKGNAKASLEASGVAQIKGGMVQIN